MHFRAVIAILLVCAAAAVTHGESVDGQGACDGLKGVNCKSRDTGTKAADSSSPPTLGKVVQQGSTGSAHKKSGCFFSNFYTGFVPFGYYKCGTNNWLAFNTLGLVYSKYCFLGKVYGTVYAYVYTTGTCRISFIQYRFFTNAVQIRAYYCC